MPSTLSGLLIFVALLTPGFIYLARVESRLPGQRYSALRETATIVTASLASGAVVIIGFGLTRFLWPDKTPDVGALVRDPNAYMGQHYLEISIWVFILISVASAVGAMVAVPPSWAQSFTSALGASTLSTWIDHRRRTPIQSESGWGVAFFAHPDTCVHVGLILMDDTYVYGPLASFNPQLEETNDRALQLVAPVRMRTPAGTELVDMVDVGALVVGASQIKTMSVYYIPIPEPEAGPTS